MANQAAASDPSRILALSKSKAWVEGDLMADAAQMSVTDLVRNFADACRALVPSLNRTHIPWTDGQQYDNWDRIAEVLFESFVLEPCRFQAQEVASGKPLITARYGFPTGSETAYVNLKVDSGVDCRFVQFLSVERPFDHIEGMVDGDKLILPVDDADLRFVIVTEDGSRNEIESVILEL